MRTDRLIQPRQLSAAQQRCAPAGLALRVLSGLVLAILLSACATRSVRTDSISAQLAKDAYFGAKPDEVDVSAIFTATPEMRRYLAEDIAQELRVHGRTKGLYRALFQSAQLKLEYDSMRTTGAAETFSSRHGNCLSLVIMTAALADALKLPVTFYNIRIGEQWTQRGDLYFASGHVNIMLGRSERSLANTKTNALIVDFAPIEAEKISTIQRISRARIKAMFANNRAAENLAAGQLNHAYWWAQLALASDPEYRVALNTLAVVFRRTGHPALAEIALRRLREYDPDNVHAVVNLQMTLRDLGRRAEAADLDAELKRLRPVALNTDYRRAMEQLTHKDYVGARDSLKQEIKRQPTCADCRFQLARVYLALGQYPNALEQLRKALAFSGSIAERNRYAAKLELLAPD